MRRQAYQQSVLTLCRRIVDNERADKEPERIDLPNGGDFGFYDPEGVLEWGLEYYLSNRNPGHLPRPGGLMGQTAAVRHDLRLLMTLIGWARGEASAEEYAQNLVDKMMAQNVDYNT